MATAAIVGAFLAPQRALSGDPALCPFRRATGRPCPACGLTRSIHAATHLRLRESVRLHPLGLAALAGLAAVAAGRWVPSAERGAPDRRFIAGSAIWLGTWLVRLRGRA